MVQSTFGRRFRGREPIAPHVAPDGHINISLTPDWWVVAVTAAIATNLEETGYDSARARIFFDQMHDGLIASRGLTNVGSAQLIPLRGRAFTREEAAARDPSAVGVYGVVTFAVSAHTREIGIRLALGASGRSVRRLVFSEGAHVVGVGMVIGLLGALVAAQVLRGILVGAPALDATVFGGAAFILLIAAAVAVTLPASRASRIDPMLSLRED